MTNSTHVGSCSATNGNGVRNIVDLELTYSEVANLHRMVD